jgi:hypothetical protein
MLQEMQQEIKKKMLEGIRRWCFANRQAPHPDIDRAVDLMLTASREGMMADTSEPDEDETSESAVSEEGTKAALEAEKTLLSLETPEEQAQLAAAQKQLNGYMESFGSMAEMIASLQLDPPAP